MYSSEELQELWDQFHENFNELKRAVESQLSPSEREIFKRRCLSNCEPGLFNETNWVTKYSGITPLENYIERVIDEVKDEELAQEEEDACPT